MENDVQNVVCNHDALFHFEFFCGKCLDIPRNITYSLSNVKLILVTNNYFLKTNEVIKGLMSQKRIYVTKFSKYDA